MSIQWVLAGPNSTDAPNLNKRLNWFTFHGPILGNWETKQNKTMILQFFWSSSEGSYSTHRTLVIVTLAQLSLLTQATHHFQFFLPRAICHLPSLSSSAVPSWPGQEQVLDTFPAPSDQSRVTLLEHNFILNQAYASAKGKVPANFCVSFPGLLYKKINCHKSRGLTH